MYMKHLRANLFMAASAYHHRPVSLDRQILGKGKKDTQQKIKGYALHQCRITNLHVMFQTNFMIQELNTDEQLNKKGS